MEISFTKYLSSIPESAIPKHAKSEIILLLLYLSLSAKDFKRGKFSVKLEISLAKHKKKKSPPTPDPEDEKKSEPEPDEEQTPPTEKDIPPTEPLASEYETSRNKYMINKLFWLRIALALIAGTAATFIFDSIEGEDRRWASVAFMIIIFIVSVGIAKGMKMQLPRSDRKKLVTTAIGSFVFLYLFSWIVSYTLVNITGNESGVAIPFP